MERARMRVITTHRAQEHLRQLMSHRNSKPGSAEAGYPARSASAPADGMSFKAEVKVFGLAYVLVYLERWWSRLKR